MHRQLSILSINLVFLRYYNPIIIRLETIANGNVTKSDIIWMEPCVKIVCQIALFAIRQLNALVAVQVIIFCQQILPVHKHAQAHFIMIT
jgi:hypothetical protein